MSAEASTTPVNAFMVLVLLDVVLDIELDFLMDTDLVDVLEGVWEDMVDGENKSESCAGASCLIRLLNNTALLALPQHAGLRHTSPCEPPYWPGILLRISTRRQAEVFLGNASVAVALDVLTGFKG